VTAIVNERERVGHPLFHKGKNVATHSGIYHTVNNGRGVERERERDIFRETEVESEKTALL